MRFKFPLVACFFSNGYYLYVYYHNYWKSISLNFIDNSLKTSAHLLYLLTTINSTWSLTASTLTSKFGSGKQYTNLVFWGIFACYPRRPISIWTRAPLWPARFYARVTRTGRLGSYSGPEVTTSQVKLILSPKQRAKPAASRTRTCTNAQCV
jgi:hypothetical protein